MKPHVMLPRQTLATHAHVFLGPPTSDLAPGGHICSHPADETPCLHDHSSFFFPSFGILSTSFLSKHVFHQVAGPALSFQLAVTGFSFPAFETSSMRAAFLPYFTAL